MFNPWNKISLFKFQQIEEINSRDISEVDKTLFATCVVFNLTEFQLDQLPLRKAQKLINKVTKIFITRPDMKPREKVGKYTIITDPSKLTFGQYIELAFFLQDNWLRNAHFVLASLASADADNHKERADYFLRKPVTKLLGVITVFAQNFEEFNKEYKSLFGLSAETNPNEQVQVDRFNKRYGWIYAASQVAEYERITLDDAFALPVRRAFNDLAYLKAKGIYEAEQIKKSKWQRNPL